MASIVLLLGSNALAGPVNVSGTGGFDYQADVVQPWTAPVERVVVFERLSSFIGDLYLTRSDDAGASWSAPIPVVTGPANQRHADLVQTGDNNYQLFYLSNATGSFRIHRSSSTDLVSFTDHGALSLGWGSGGEINPQVIRRPDGQLLMVYHRLSGAAYIAQSSNGGVTWDQNRVQVSPSTAALPRLTYRPSDGRYLLIYQTNPGNNQLRMWSRTTTNPASWADTPVEVASGGNNHDGWPIVRGDDQFMLFWARVVGNSFQLFSSVSADGSSWSTRVQRVDRPGLFNIQPHVIDIGNGELDLYWGAAQDGAGNDYNILRDRVIWDVLFRNRFE
ncbi:MAG: exo-alpha-sialidase [Pseudomonadota bacterium]